VSQSRVLRLRSLKLQLAEAEHLRAVCAEKSALAARDEARSLQDAVLDMGHAHETVDMHLLRWLEPIESAIARACEWHESEVIARSRAQADAATVCANERRKFERTQERALSEAQALERTRSLAEADRQANSAKRLGQPQP
jgi:hypothetical protein